MRPRVTAEELATITGVKAKTILKIARQLREELSLDEMVTEAVE
jgi:hypothetical protein